MGGVLGYIMVKLLAIAILTGGGSCILVWRVLLVALAVTTEGNIWHTWGYNTPK